MSIAIVTDSSCQLSTQQIADAGVSVVPIPIIIDYVEYADGVDLSAAEFYERIGDGVTLSTSLPSPGAFIEAWMAAEKQGASEIVSVHVGLEHSGTLNSARLAADELEIPVHLIDSKTTSYGLGIVVLEIAKRVSEIGSTAGIDEFANSLIAGIGTVFMLQDLKYVLKGGRMRQAKVPTGANDIPVLGGVGGGYELLGTGRTIDELVDMMATALLEGDHQRHIAIALAAPDTIEFTEKLEALAEASALVESVHRYRMGPAIAVHTGPGTAGGFQWPS
jgi:DegV family protein with EDD domain